MHIERREAFDLLIEAWSAELGAVSFAETVKLLDLLFLVSVVENRSVGENLRRRMEVLNDRMTRIEEQLGST
jgi:hypothetical protein